MEKIIAGENYTDDVFDGQDLRSCDLSECTFVHCSFIGCDFTDVKANASKFQDCTLENAKIAGLNLFDATFSGCKLSGIDFSNKTKLLATSFDTSLLDYANFTGVDLSSLRFDRCSFIETNFSKSNVQKTVFENCLIQDAIFSGARFEMTDLHTSTLSGVNIYEDKLKGIILSKSQFLSLAADVGVTIV